MSGKAKLNHPSKTPDITNGVAIPQTALCHRPTEGDYLWVVDANTQQVNLRKVKKRRFTGSAGHKGCTGRAGYCSECI